MTLDHLQAFGALIGYNVIHQLLYLSTTRLAGTGFLGHLSVMRLLTSTLLLLITLTALAIPSQRDQLNAQYIKARGDYATSLKSGNKDMIMQAVAGLQAVGKAVMNANEAAISASGGGYSYPGDVKTSSGRKSYDQKMADHNKALRAANAAIEAIPAPADTTPTSLRAVDQLINAISKGIEVHHTACQNIR